MFSEILYILHFYACREYYNGVSQSRFAKPSSLKNIIITIVIFRLTYVEFSGLFPTASHRVVSEFIQSGGAFAKLKQITLCQLHGASLCFLHE